MTTTSMATRSTTSRAAFGLLAAALAASLLGGSCECGAPPLDPSELIGDGFAAVDAVDAQTVRVRFADPVEADSVADAFSLTDFTSVPPLGFEVLPRRTAEREVTLSVARNLVAGVSYTIVVDGVRTTTGRTLSGDRRVAAKRHGEGANLLFFDGHAGWKNGRAMTVEDWREQRY